MHAVLEYISPSCLFCTKGQNGGVASRTFVADAMPCLLGLLPVSLLGHTRVPLASPPMVWRFHNAELRPLLSALMLMLILIPVLMPSYVCHVRSARSTSTLTNRRVKWTGALPTSCSRTALSLTSTPTPRQVTFCPLAGYHPKPSHFT